MLSLAWTEKSSLVFRCSLSLSDEEKMIHWHENIVRLAGFYRMAGTFLGVLEIGSEFCMVMVRTTTSSSTVDTSTSQVLYNTRADSYSSSKCFLLVLHGTTTWYLVLVLVLMY